MPGMDGFELIERVRASAGMAAIPIIVVSADGGPETQARARRLGANAFFVKPYSPAAVRQRLEELLHAGPPCDSL
jgi:CheY-like chemotaxis protein